jgi:hypothetical protein
MARRRHTTFGHRGVGGEVSVPCLARSRSWSRRVSTGWVSGPSRQARATVVRRSSLTGMATTPSRRNGWRALAPMPIARPVAMSGVGQQRLAGVGEPHLAGRALEQLEPQPALELGDLTAHRGGVEMECLGGPSEAVGPCHLDEGSQQGGIGVHGGSPCRRRSGRSSPPHRSTTSPTCPTTPPTDPQRAGPPSASCR